MPRPDVDPQFAGRLRTLREQHGLSLRELARLALSSKSHLHQFEHGTKVPGPDTLRRLDEVLAAGGELLDMVTAPAGGDGTDGLEFPTSWAVAVGVPPRLWRGDMLRRDALRRARFAPAAYAGPAMRCLTAGFDERPYGAGAVPVSDREVETIRQMAATLRGLDNRFGGGHIRETTVRYLASDVAPLLTDGAYDPDTGAALLSATAEMTHLAGWAAYDAGLHGLAQRYLIQALRLAVAGGDRALAAELLAAMSHQAAYLRAPAEAVDLARAADRLAADAGVSAIRAEAAVLEAQGHAVGGDEPTCVRALDRAEHTLDAADRTRDPRWIGYLDETYLAAKFGHSFAALGRGDLAARFAARSLEVDGRRYTRGRQFNLALLATAHAQAGDVDRAASVGMQAADAAEGLRSARATDYLRDLADRLAVHAGVPAVRDFIERTDPLLRTG